MTGGSVLAALGVEESPGVWVAPEGLQVVTDEMVAALAAAATERGRARVLLHRHRDDKVQQMLIALRGGDYFRPHLNDRGFKEWHALRGTLRFGLFDDEGSVREVVDFGDGTPVSSVRLLERAYHTVVPVNDPAVYVETCAGPFVTTTYAPWAPDDADVGAAWLRELLGSG